MAVLDRPQRAARHRRQAQAREVSHKRSTRPIVGQQGIVSQHGHSIARRTNSRSGMFRDLARRTTDEIRFLAKAPKFLWPENS
jgi:hypothetical protein